VEGLGGVHRLRAIRSGDVVHVDAHLFVPEHWSVLQAHAAVTELEEQVKARSGLVGELALHLDPCDERACSDCELRDCDIRREPFVAKRVVTVEEAVAPSSTWRRHRL
jgi:divalent metal cation (Fe/Co/Zn/Cd) transporter